MTACARVRVCSSRVKVRVCSSLVRGRSMAYECECVRVWVGLSVSELECLLMRVFVCMYTQVCACLSAYARVRRHAVWSVRHSHSNRRHSSRKSLSSKLFKVEKN